jgi:hypothetical protein
MKKRAARGGDDRNSAPGKDREMGLDVSVSPEAFVKLERGYQPRKKKPITLARVSILEKSNEQD